MIKSILVLKTYKFIFLLLCSSYCVIDAGGIGYEYFYGSSFGSHHNRDARKLLEEEKLKHRNAILELLHNHTAIEQLNNPLQISLKEVSPVVLMASRYDYGDLLELLLKQGADATAKGEALVQAAIRLNLTALRLLLQYRANPNVSDETGHTALMWAAHKGDKLGLIALLHNKMLPADPTIKDDHNEDALMWLARSLGKDRCDYQATVLGMMRELIYHGANPYTRSTRTGETVLDVLRKNPKCIALADFLENETKGRVEILTIVLSRGFEKGLAPLPYDLARKIAILRYGYHELWSS